MPDDDEILRLLKAADWIVRPRDSSSPATSEAWCARDPLNEAALARMQAVWDAFGAPEPRTHVPAPSRIAGYGLRLGQAACLAGLLALGLWVLSGSFVSRTLVCEPGAPRHFVLPDGSQLDLAPESRASLRFSPLRREVRLEQGRAYFTVAQGGVRPFAVVAGALTATGTAAAFDVRMGPPSAVISVGRGRVTVQVAGQDLLAPVLAGAGQQVSFSLHGSCCSVSALAPRQAGCSGVLQFIGAPLGEVVADLNGYVKHRIELAPAAQEARFTGTVAPERVDEFLEALQQIYPFQIVKESARVSVTY